MRSLVGARQRNRAFFEFQHGDLQRGIAPILTKINP